MNWIQKIEAFGWHDRPLPKQGTITELERRIGVKTNYLHGCFAAAEKGRVTRPRVDIALQIANFFDVTVEWLFDDKTGEEGEGDTAFWLRPTDPLPARGLEIVRELENILVRLCIRPRIAPESGHNGHPRPPEGTVTPDDQARAQLLARAAAPDSQQLAKPKRPKGKKAQQ